MKPVQNKVFTAIQDVAEEQELDKRRRRLKASSEVVEYLPAR